MLSKNSRTAIIILSVMSFSFLLLSTFARLPLSSTLNPVNEDALASSTQQEDFSMPVTMKEAIKIADTKAKQWSENAYLNDLTSQDSPVATEEWGMEGKQYIWNITYVDPKQIPVKQYVIQIINGKISKADEYFGGVISIISNLQIKFDSSYAYELALREKNLRPGVPGINWAVGYNYSLARSTFYQYPGKEFIVLSILGATIDGNFARVDIDQETGEIINAEEKIVDSEGNEKWQKWD